MSSSHTTWLLDLDGTLTDNYPGISRSIVFALDRMGVEAPDAATLRRCVGPPLRESFGWLLDTSDAETIETAIGHYRERFGDIGWRENVVYDGIVEAMTRMADNGTPMYLCTSKPEIFARRIVTLFGFSTQLKGIYGADLAGRFDDKVKLFAHIVTAESLDPDHAIMIGDRSHDLRAARMNGARAVGVLWGYGSREELAGADALAERPHDLPDVLRALAIHSA